MSRKDEFAFTAGNVDITPSAKVPLASYRGLRKSTFDIVADELEANVVVLRHGGEPAAIFLSIDLLYVGAYICNRVTAALAGRVPRERILMAATHTHFAPASEESLPALGRVAPEYLELVAARIIALIERLLDAAPTPIECRYHEGAALHSVNRRRSRFGFWKRYPYIGFHTEIAPNEDGPRDDLIRVLALTEPGGRIGAVCWSYACHPNTFPRIDSVSAEYPGRVRQSLRSRFGPIPVLFWQGFSGNVNPHRTARNGGADIDRPPEFVTPTPRQWEGWARSLSETVQQTLATPGKPVFGPVTCQSRSLSVRELGLRSDKLLTFRKIAIGPDLVICALSAEVAVEYVARMRAVFPGMTVIPIGCADDVFGYLPVDDMIDSGGYEVRGFLRRFGLNGRFRNDICEVVERRLLLASDGGSSKLQLADGLSARNLG